MISYLIYTTVCMGLVLLFYHLVLAKEKIYQINRWYLLVGLAFTLLVPFLPVGIADFSFNAISGEKPSVLTKSLDAPVAEALPEKSAGRPGNSEVTEPSPAESGYSILFYLYGVMTLLLIIRLGWQYFEMRKKAMRNPVSLFKGHKIIMLDEAVVPHTFGKTIYVNRQQFERGKISREMLLHELTHARENHSLDILFIELLKAICWFNPVLYFYKSAIQMNHEFIADQNVLSGGTDIANYQNALLSLGKRKPAGSLSTSLNFNVTKKRFKMMTTSTSACQYILKSALIIPFFALLALTFGCEPTSMEKNPRPQKIQLDILDGETVNLEGKTIPLSQFASAFSGLAIDPNKVIVSMNVHESASMGAVTEVQSILRQQGALKINYSTDSSGDSDREVKKSQLKKERNLLTIYINKEGNILIDQEATPLSSVKNVVRKFITNNGESADLSETPKDAIVSFKTDRQTPKDTYTKTLEKVLAVYGELRNQESIRLFGKPYTELEEGSRQQGKIEELYPKRISIREPSK